MITRWILPLVLGFNVVTVFGWPMLRMRLQAGHLGVAVGARRRPAEAIVELAMGLVFAGVAAWCGLVACLGPDALGVWSAPRSVWAAGLAGVAVGWLLIVLAQRQMGLSWRIGIDREQTALVARGLYRVCRNPIYAGLLVMLIGIAMVTPCGWTVLSVPVVALILSLQARLEERHLTEQHGEAYLSYASRVGRFVPGLGLHRTPSR